MSPDAPMCSATATAPAWMASGRVSCAHRHVAATTHGRRSRSRCRWTVVETVAPCLAPTDRFPPRWHAQTWRRTTQSSESFWTTYFAPRRAGLQIGKGALSSQSKAFAILAAIFWRWTMNDFDGFPQTHRIITLRKYYKLNSELTGTYVRSLRTAILNGVREQVPGLLPSILRCARQLRLPPILPLMIADLCIPCDPCVGSAKTWLIANAYVSDRESTSAGEVRGFRSSLWLPSALPRVAAAVDMRTAQTRVRCRIHRRTPYAQTLQGSSPIRSLATRHALWGLCRPRNLPVVATTRLCNFTTYMR
eukprot:COSAG01_NODE_469_length_16584_cov_10.725265_10_plen_306_part_00